MKITYDYVKEYVESFGYILISKEYINSRTKLDMICDKGHKCSINWDNFKYGKRCKECNKLNQRKRFQHNYEDVKAYVESLGFSLLSKNYSNRGELLNIKCSEGHEFSMTYKAFKRGGRCVVCSQSKGEREVMRYLRKMNIDYIYNSKYFDDLSSLKGKPLRPDFILPEYKIWIEYDGEFHYNKIYENDNYEIQKINDKIKDKYAKENNWRLIRIPYWEFDNIEKILTKELIKL